MGFNSGFKGLNSLPVHQSPLIAPALSRINTVSLKTYLFIYNQFSGTQPEFFNGDGEGRVLALKLYII